jgi:hypothetical protein
MLQERDTPLTNINDCESISFFLKQILFLFNETNFYFFFFENNFFLSF